MKVKYFAWVRERVGKAEETVEPPASVRTVDDLIGWLAKRGETYAHAFETPRVIRAAIDHAHVKSGHHDRRRPRDCLFPADDRRLIHLPGIATMTAAVTIRIQEADFDIAREIAALTHARTDIGAVVSFSAAFAGTARAATPSRR